MSLEFAERLRRIPVYPAAETYEFGGDLVKLASNETPWMPHPAVLEAIERELRTLNRSRCTRTWRRRAGPGRSRSRSTRRGATTSVQWPGR